MNISDEVLKETTLADNSELKLTENSLIHIGSHQGDSEMQTTSSIMSKLSRSSNKDNSLTDISLESIDAVRYASQIQPRLTIPSFVVSGLGAVLSGYCWYNFGLNNFAVKWAALGAVVLLIGALAGWMLRKQVFVEEVTIHLSSGETFDYIRREDEMPENAPVELLWIVQEIRQHSYK